MPLSKVNVYKKDSGNQVILDYSLKPLPKAPENQAKEFLMLQEQSQSGFQISPLVAARVGISEIQKQQLEEKIEQETLERMKGLQEKAFAEGFELGRTEGREQALAEYRNQFEESLKSLGEVLLSLERMKQSLLAQNEKGLVDLTYRIANKVAMANLEHSPILVLEVMKQVVESAQSDERLTVYLAPEDLEFVKSLQSQEGQDLDFLKKLRLEAKGGLSRGGCLVESNYGSIDATWEKRVQKVWEILVKKFPKFKSDVGEQAS